MRIADIKDARATLAHIAANHGPLDGVGWGSQAVNDVELVLTTLMKLGLADQLPKRASEVSVRELVAVLVERVDQLARLVGLTNVEAEGDLLQRVAILFPARPSHPRGDALRYHAAEVSRISDALDKAEAATVNEALGARGSLSLAVATIRRAGDACDDIDAARQAGWTAQHARLNTTRIGAGKHEVTFGAIWSDPAGEVRVVGDNWYDTRNECWAWDAHERSLRLALGGYIADGRAELLERGPEPEPRVEDGGVE